MLLHIDVVNKVATYQKRDGCIVCGNSGYQIEFNFDSEWDNVSDKQAVLIVNGTPIYADIKNTDTTYTTLLFDSKGYYDFDGNFVSSDSVKSTVHIPISSLADDTDGYCARYFDWSIDAYPKAVFFSGDTFIRGLKADSFGTEKFTAAQIKAVAERNAPNATHVVFNSAVSPVEDCVHIVAKNGSCVCDVPVIRNTDRIVVGVHSASAEMTTTGTEIPCKKSIRCI